jgi:LPS-assembly protein
LGGLANFQASGGLELASYAAEGRRPSDDKSPAGREAARHDQWDSRLTGAADLELSTTFSRVFDGGPGRAAATRHQFSPTVTFTYVGAPEDQGRLPYWDPLDRRLPRRALRYGLSNTLVSKTENEQDSGAGYFQFLKFGLWTGYEFADNSHLTDRQMERYYDVNYYGQGSTPLEVEIETFFNPYLSARLISAFDTRTGRAGRHDLNLNLSDDRGDKLTLTYDYDSPESALNRGGFNGYQEARADLTLNLDSEWSTRLFTRFDLLANRSLETTAQITYRAQCYGLGLIYSKTYADQSVGLMVDLLGLGTIGFSGGLPGSAD